MFIESACAPPLELKRAHRSEAVTSELPAKLYLLESDVAAAATLQHREDFEPPKLGAASWQTHG